ncbi:NADH-ubiquinone oxidoreductase-F iron-sulfur binding region domain-containing protein [Pseudonocardia abyssalis]|uniref:NAD(P)H-dependent oxidoreductase subunit E n=1 Tax=Pseudonocardia abyssalis TaxID=2792008 RepID=A0ABS6UR85_9PSEU|nr:NADH-ubiquinone oxidoreductase-F iron-sulfur binding region domain-containing protein [Pseudonocardia abyssalis]MBW0118561.1 NAD(P)H-dependent oxidoreductase subunit E [Pseudonocardia abyssalis]MBW0134264.1 NAD(P)H-dependent oxidoreductase subunit E [Pseudonocardia abyssalis]
MDLRISSASPSDAERAAVDAVLGGTGDPHFADAGHAARARRHLLLPALHAVMDAVGWISPGALNHVSRRLSVPPADAYGVATFYAMLATEPQAPRVVHVCDDVACGPFGGEEILSALDGGPDGVEVVRSPCLGLCERAPAVLFQLAGEPDFSIAPARPADVTEVASGVVSGEAGQGAGHRAREADAAFADASVSVPQVGDPDLRLLRRVGVVDPDSLDDYRAHGGYQALRRAVELGPTRVITEVTDASLTGRGGAAFPTGVKWDGVAKAPERPHYLVCNADESEPGTFKDRVLMESDPFGLIEAMTIAGYATGCERGYLYIRGEYPLATRRLEQAIAAARTRGYLGEDVMGEGFAFDIELRRGAGAYICGEETALLNSIEGFRGEPRNKPPFPSVKGLFGKPTVINNVETLYNALDVLAIGGPAFASIGSGRSTGHKLFCLSGAVAVPGVYEVPFGTTLRELLDLAGGLRGELRTILLGGAAGGFVMPDQLDVVLTLEGSRSIEATLGSGVVMAFDTDADLVGTLRRIAAFFRDESCGQCVPCRVGTVRQEESLARLERGAPRGPELTLLGDLARVMQDASICGLGHTAPAAVQSALRLGLLDTPVDGARNGKVSHR